MCNPAHQLAQIDTVVWTRDWLREYPEACAIRQPGGRMDGKGGNGPIPHRVRKRKETTPTSWLARQYLREHPEACKVALDSQKAPRSKFSRKDDQHKHGSVPCLLAFLGEVNWEPDRAGGWAGKRTGMRVEGSAFAAAFVAAFATQIQIKIQIQSITIEYQHPIRLQTMRQQILPLDGLGESLGCLGCIVTRLTLPDERDILELSAWMRADDYRSVPFPTDIRP